MAKPRKPKAARAKRAAKAKPAKAKAKVAKAKAKVAKAKPAGKSKVAAKSKEALAERAKPARRPPTRAKSTTVEAGGGDAALAAPTSYVKVFLHDGGQDLEAAWCEPAGEEAGRALFRLVNVPFAHPKPTFGDVIAARRDDEYGGNWAWNRGGAALEELPGRLHHDSGRYTLIVEYHATEEGDFDGLCRQLHRAHGVVSELAYGPRGNKPGRLFLAAPAALDPPAVLEALTAAGRSYRFTLVHPA